MMRLPLYVAALAGQLALFAKVMATHRICSGTRQRKMHPIVGLWHKKWATIHIDELRGFRDRGQKAFAKLKGCILFPPPLHIHPERARRWLQCSSADSTWLLDGVDRDLLELPQSDPRWAELPLLFFLSNNTVQRALRGERLDVSRLLIAVSIFVIPRWHGPPIWGNAAECTLAAVVMWNVLAILQQRPARARELIARIHAPDGQCLHLLFVMKQCQPWGDEHFHHLILLLQDARYFAHEEWDVVLRQYTAELPHESLSNTQSTALESVPPVARGTRLAVGTAVHDELKRDNDDQHHSFTSSNTNSSSFTSSNTNSSSENEDCGRLYHSRRRRSARSTPRSSRSSSSELCTPQSQAHVDRSRSRERQTVRVLSVEDCHRNCVIIRAETQCATLHRDTLTHFLEDRARAKVAYCGYEEDGAICVAFQGAAPHLQAMSNDTEFAVSALSVSCSAKCPCPTARNRALSSLSDPIQFFHAANTRTVCALKESSWLRSLPAVPHWCLLASNFFDSNCATAVVYVCYTEFLGTYTVLRHGAALSV